MRLSTGTMFATSMMMSSMASPAFMAARALSLVTPLASMGMQKGQEKKRKKELETLKEHKETIIFYEAPHRINETLNDIVEVFGDRYCVLARELTKTYEEFLRDKASELAKIEGLKGEMVLMVEGYKETVKAVENPCVRIDELVSLGYKPNEAIKEVSKLFNVDRKELYKEYLEYKNNKSE